MTKQVKQDPKRGRKIFLSIVITVLFLEVIALSWLYLSVNRYKKFWDEKSKERGEITYLALGDSAAQGIGATSPMRGYVGIIANRLDKKTGKTVKIVNVSKTGAKIQDYLDDQAKYLDDYQPDVVTIEIGANDIANFNALDFKESFQKVLKTLPDGSYVSNMPLFNSRPSSTKNAKEASSIIKQELSNYPKLNFVDLQEYTSENQSVFGFAPDLFHPNNLSYKNWANAFWDRINQNNNF